MTTYTEIYNYTRSLAVRIGNEIEALRVEIAAVSIGAVDWVNVTNKPTEFPPAAHTTSLITDFNSAVGALIAVASITSSQVSNFNTSVDARIAAASITASQVSNFNTAVAARMLIEPVPWANLTGKPTTFEPVVETVQDIVGAMAVAGTNITLTYNDGAGTLTIAATGGGGGGDLVAANNLSDVANAGTSRTNLGLAIGTNVQAYNANLTTFAGIAPSANVQTLLGAVDYAAFRTSLGLVIGTNVQAYSANLTTFAGIAPSANVQSLLGAADYAAMRTALGLVIGTNVQAYDADLTTWAGLTPSANAQSLVTAANYAAMRTLLGLVVGTDVQAYDADLGAIAALASAADKMPYSTGAQAWALTDLTAAARTVLDDTTVAAMRTTLDIQESFIVAIGDETTALTTGVNKVVLRMPYAFTLTEVKSSVNTAPTGAALIVDINEAGVTILSTKLSIDATEKTSATAASAAVISDTALAADAEISFDIDQIGSTVAGAGLKVTLIGRRT